MSEPTVTWMKRGDTRPDLTVICTDGGTPVDLTSADSIRVIGSQDNAQLFAKATTGDATGRVSVALTDTDTATPGSVRVEVEVTWAAGQIQTFPPEGYLTLSIARDLDGGT